MSQDLKAKKRIEKRRTCDICSKTFCSTVTLKNHYRTHTGETPFPCGVCNKLFRYKSHITRHMLIHTGEKPYKCKYCDKKFNQNETLKNHMYSIHKVEKKNLITCLICDKKFSTTNKFKLHKKMHVNYCNKCKISFDSKKKYNLHIKNHKIDFKCNLCEEIFINDIELRHHKLIHDTEIFYDCNVCFKLFVQKDDLEKHLTSHKNIVKNDHSYFNEKNDNHLSYIDLGDLKKESEYLVPDATVDESAVDDVLKQLNKIEIYTNQINQNTTLVFEAVEENPVIISSNSNTKDKPEETPVMISSNLDFKDDFDIDFLVKSPKRRRRKPNLLKSIRKEI